MVLMARPRRREGTEGYIMVHALFLLEVFVLEQWYVSTMMIQVRPRRNRRSMEFKFISTTASQRVRANQANVRRVRLRVLWYMHLVLDIPFSAVLYPQPASKSHRQYFLSCSSSCTPYESHFEVVIESSERNPIPPLHLDPC